MKKALCTAVLASSLLLGAGDVLAMEHNVRGETPQNSISLPAQNLSATGSVDFNQMLIQLVRSRGSEFVKLLVDCDASAINDGTTALQSASHCGHLDIVKYLVEECHCDVSEKR